MAWSHTASRSRVTPSAAARATISSNIRRSRAIAVGLSTIPCTVVPSAAVSGPAVAAIASFVQITRSASASITHGSPAVVSAEVKASTPSGIPRPVRGGPSWVIDRPLEVIGDTSTTPGSDLCAPAVVVPGSTRSGPSTAARATSLPRPFCTVATQVERPTAPAIDSATSRLAQPLQSTMTASTGSSSLAGSDVVATSTRSTRPSA